MICDHCLAPDTSGGAGIGCDNMTVMIVAILGGRTNEEWYSWIADRVKCNYGYETPTTVPQIYAQHRLVAFKARQEAQEERDRRRADRDDSASGSSGSSLGRLANVLGTPGGIAFYQSGGISGGLMFRDDSDDEDDDDDSADEMDGIEGGRSFFSDTLGIGGPRSPDATSNLKAQLDDFEKEIRDDQVDGETHPDDAKSDAPFGMDGLPDGDPKFLRV